jgi:hypothetical protein
LEFGISGMVVFVKINTNLRMRMFGPYVPGLQKRFRVAIKNSIDAILCGTYGGMKLHGNFLVEKLFN